MKLNYTRNAYFLITGLISWKWNSFDIRWWIHGNSKRWINENRDFSWTPRFRQWDIFMKAAVFYMRVDDSIFNSFLSSSLWCARSWLVVGKHDHARLTRIVVQLSASPYVTERLHEIDENRFFFSFSSSYSYCCYGLCQSGCDTYAFETTSNNIYMHFSEWTLLRPKTYSVRERDQSSLPNA